MPIFFRFGEVYGTQISQFCYLLKLLMVHYIFFVRRWIATNQRKRYCGEVRNQSVSKLIAREGSSKRRAWVMAAGRYARNDVLSACARVFDLI